METTGITIDCVKRTSEKTGADYLSINLGSLGTLMVYLQTSNAVLYPREPKHSKNVVSITTVKKAANKAFFDDPIPDFPA